MFHAKQLEGSVDLRRIQDRRVTGGVHLRVTLAEVEGTNDLAIGGVHIPHLFSLLRRRDVGGQESDGPATGGDKVSHA